MSSISSADDHYHWRHHTDPHQHSQQHYRPQHPHPQQQQHQYHDALESDNDSRVAGSQLVDSCLRVLQERGVVDNSDEPLIIGDHNFNDKRGDNDISYISTNLGYEPSHSPSPYNAPITDEMSDRDTPTSSNRHSMQSSGSGGGGGGDPKSPMELTKRTTQQTQQLVRIRCSSAALRGREMAPPYTDEFYKKGASWTT
ncbi:PREDICTED: DNA N6-methyl adenine demethylase-like, partial [Priapulus caudatus]|uniref:DNA N6-methyl adenine demethylase-like n=1 Tax=Priapulus caudatus TaxID=37621 RepID=A0ABM1F4Y4_PRICU